MPLALIRDRLFSTYVKFPKFHYFLLPDKRATMDFISRWLKNLAVTFFFKVACKIPVQSQ